jgi:hypothetical protein
MTEWLGRLWFPDTSRLDVLRALVEDAEDDGYRRGVVVRYEKPDPAKVQMRRTERLKGRVAAWARRG